MKITSLEIYGIVTAITISIAFLIPLLYSGFKFDTKGSENTYHTIFWTQIITVGCLLAVEFFRYTQGLGVLIISCMSVGVLGGYLVGQRVGRAWNR